MYFGFCHCPDICPETMEKVMDIIDIHNEEKNKNPSLPDILPVFISIGMVSKIFTKKYIQNIKQY